MAENEIQDLMDQHGEGVVKQAFALQQHIKENGIDGVHFIKTARKKTQARKYHITKKNLKHNIPKRP